MKIKMLLLVAVVVLCGNTVHAQFLPRGGSPGGGFSGGFSSASPGGIGTSGSPGFSPYLNLLRGGGSVVGNYYGIVRPQNNVREALQTLQQEIYSGGSATSEQVNPGLNVGTRVRFLNTGNYFLNLGGNSSSGSTLGSSGSGLGTGRSSSVLGSSGNGFGGNRTGKSGSSSGGTGTPGQISPPAQK
ncbi:MAG: hypothetical protein R3B84_17555 [Zavarzinella sp.]